MIISEAEVRGVHYVLHEGYGGSVPYNSADYFVKFTLYAIKDGYGEEISRWAIPSAMDYKCETKILGVLQTSSGKWRPVLGRETEEFFGEEPLVPPCGDNPEVCCKRGKVTTHGHGLPYASWSQTHCECGKWGMARKFPSPNWSEESGAG